MYKIMMTGEAEVLLKFAKELRELVESFEEELEILADRAVLEEIRESEDSYRRGEGREFKDIEDLKRELGL